MILDVLKVFHVAGHPLTAGVAVQLGQVAEQPGGVERYGVTHKVAFSKAAAIKVWFYFLRSVVSGEYKLLRVVAVV